MEDVGAHSCRSSFPHWILTKSSDFSPIPPLTYPSIISANAQLAEKGRTENIGIHALWSSNNIDLGSTILLRQLSLTVQASESSSLVLSSGHFHMDTYGGFEQLLILT
jgi:hypothetical protein